MITKTKPTRKAGGYRYRDKNFNVLHTTSLPTSDKEALLYFARVSGWFRSVDARYLERREVGGWEFQFIPVEFIEGRVEHFEQSSD